MNQFTFLAGLLITLALFIPPANTTTMQASWLVSPLVCVTEYLGEQCEMPVEIVFDKLPRGNYCLYQDESLLQCWHTNSKKLQLQLRFAHPIWLVLKDSTGKLTLKQQLNIKAQQSANKRSRIRSPWSLF